MFTCICHYCKQETGVGTAALFDTVLKSRKTCDKCGREFLIVNDIHVTEEQSSRATDALFGHKKLSRTDRHLYGVLRVRSRNDNHGATPKAADTGWTERETIILRPRTEARCSATSFHRIARRFCFFGLTGFQTWEGLLCVSGQNSILIPLSHSVVRLAPLRLKFCC